MTTHKVLVLALASTGSTAMFAAESICAHGRPALMSITLDMTLKDVEKRMGPGKLTARAPDPDADWQYYYAWRRGSVRIEVVFDRVLKVAMVSVASRVQTRVVGEVTLNRDTVEGVERKLGQPVDKTGPEYGEGEYTFYSLIYRCAGDEVLFMSELECNRPDMNACLSEELLARKPIVKVAIRRPPKTPGP